MPDGRIQIGGGLHLPGGYAPAPEQFLASALAGDAQADGHGGDVDDECGLRGQAGQSNYAASKAGIIGFSKSIAEEFGSRNIRCNAISPGFIETDMTHVLAEDTKKNLLSQIPLGRMGQAEDIANAALFLGSDMSAYITGQVLSVCGGMSR